MESPQGGSRGPAATLSVSATSPSEEPSAPRPGRIASATQACETCRTRKSRCDENRPKCSLCKRLNVPCQYREPLPTKKDKSITFMMQQLNRMESKLNVIGASISPQSEVFDTPASAPRQMTESLVASSGPQSVENPSPHSHTASVARSSQTELNTLPSERSTSYQHLTTPHKVLLWPAINDYMQRSGIDTIRTTEVLKNEGTAWFLRLEMRKYNQSLPCNTSLQSRPAVPRQSPDTQSRVAFASLGEERIMRLIDSYFDSYNVLYPLIDKDEFLDNILPEVLEEGFGYGDFASVLVLLMCALGQIAHEGIWGDAIEVRDGWESGIRGGNAARPPGLDIFNEARMRTGFILTQTSLENIQILQLTAVYHEACSRHLEFWRASVSASMAFQMLVKIEPVALEDWDTPRGHQIRMVYWTCNLIENWYHMDLDLPRTGIEDLEDKIPLPGKATKDSQQEQIKMQFLAMITLRRVISRIHVTIFEAVDNSESSDDYAGPPMHVIKELARQLDKWRTLLPRALQWSDHSRVPPTPPAGAPVGSPVELGNSHLRSRYYYARFMIYRPLVYKALHFPAQMSEEDIVYTAECLKACMLWPISMDPPRMSKRLIPYLFAWSQNFLGVLLILRMTSHNRMLMSIADRHMNIVDVEKTVELLLDWFRDMRQVDGMAEWAWSILIKLYPIPP